MQLNLGFFMLLVDSLKFSDHRLDFSDIASENELFRTGAPHRAMDFVTGTMIAVMNDYDIGRSYLSEYDRIVNLMVGLQKRAP